MSLETVSPAGGESLSAPDDAAIAVHIPGQDGPYSLRDAARSVTDWRRKRDAQANKPAEPNGAETAAAVEPQESTAQAEDANPPQEAPGETQANEPEETLPPIEPPRSWTKEAKERWASLPRETQDYIATREQDREREFRRSQNEAAEQRKAIEAERSKVEQARQQYEAALPALLQTLHEQQAGDFADIKSMADITRLATEDPLRFAQWQASQVKIAAVHQQIQEAQQRQATEAQQKWAEFVQKEDSLAVEKIPELADKDKAAKIQSSAVEVLRNLGFTDQELGKLYRGEDKISLRDHRLSLLIYDAVKYREAQAKAKVAAAKPVPPVQKPGVAQPRNAAELEQVANLDKRLNQSGSLKDAAALIAARRRAATR